MFFAVVVAPNKRALARLCNRVAVNDVIGEIEIARSLQSAMRLQIFVRSEFPVFD